MRHKLIVGNWKMNGSLAANGILLAGIKSAPVASSCTLAVCVPAPYLAQCQSELTGTSIAWGAQEVSAHGAGAFTGEISVGMLRDFGCRYVLIGHSERRLYHGENDEIVAEKVKRALVNSVTPIVCVGETLEEREAGQTSEVVSRQLETVLEAIGASDIPRIVVAYEPVWAIGTGKTATPQMAQDVHGLLRTKLAERNQAAAQQVNILYGGSMRPDNARELLQMPDIDGGLIGGASLNAADFVAIANAA